MITFAYNLSAVLSLCSPSCHTHTHTPSGHTQTHTHTLTKGDTRARPSPRAKKRHGASHASTGCVGHPELSQPCHLMAEIMQALKHSLATGCAMTAGAACSGCCNTSFVNCRTSAMPGTAAASQRTLSPLLLYEKCVSAQGKKRKKETPQERALHSCTPTRQRRYSSDCCIVVNPEASSESILLQTSFRRY